MKKTSSKKKPWTPARIKKLREALDLTQAAFATKLGVSTLTVSRWENGKGVPSPLARAAMGAIEGL